MARRVLEAAMLEKNGIVQVPMGTAKSLELVKAVRLHKTTNGVFSLQFNYTGELFAAGLGTGGIYIYETQSGKMINELRPCRQGGFSVSTLHFHPKEPHILYAATSEGLIHVYNVKTGISIDTITEAGNEINTLDFSMDGYNFVTGGKDLNIRVYETRSNKIVKEWQGLNASSVMMDTNKVGNTMRIFAIKFHPNNQFIFISGGWDNHLKIWDVRDNEGIKRNIRGPHICGETIDIMENEILSGQWTALHALQEYNYTTGHVTREIKFPHKEGAFLYAAQYCNSNLVIAGGSGTNSAEVIEIATNRVVGSYKVTGPIHAVDSANQGRLLVAGGASPVFAILKIID